MIIALIAEPVSHGLSQKAVELARPFGFPITNSMVVTWIVALALIVFAQVATRKMTEVPSGPQNLLEWLVESLYGLLESMIGHHLVERTFWFFGTVFIFILAANWLSLLPGVGTIGWGHATEHGFVVQQPLFRGANADLNLTLAMALVFFAPRQQIDGVAARLVAAFSDSTSGQAWEAVAALASVRDQPLIIASLIGYFEGLRAEERTRRVTTLAIIGELRRIDATPFFQKVIWTPLPTSESRGELSTVSGLEEMVRIKAVHGLAYLRTTDADGALIDIMRRHDSVAVKIAAIDSYMWNHDDSAGAAQTLYGELPPDFHKFVQRPRFHAGADRKQFNERLRAWQEKWASRQAKP